MNTKENRYSASWERISRRMRLLYPCYICGENDINKKECHHIDCDKKNNRAENLVVLCRDHHREQHLAPTITESPYKSPSLAFRINIVQDEEWIATDSKIRLIPGLIPEIANEFRKKHIKGFVKPGSCNYYIGMIVDNVLIGVLGFSNPEYGSYSLFLKADTTPSVCEYSTDLLLYVLRTKEVKNYLEARFNREIKSVYSKCFSAYDTISRYRKHGELITKKPMKSGFNLGYLFEMGTIPSIKEARAQFFQKHKL